jgi:hypothetical protein
MQKITILEKTAVIEKTKNWIQKFVIGLNLCPFAKFPVENDQVRYVVYEGDSLLELLQLLAKELLLLKKLPAKEVETTFIVTPNYLSDFQDFINAIPAAEEVLKLQKMRNDFQIATFHPKYQFAGTQAEAIENYTNRSPFPMLHLLREDSMDKAIESYGNTEMIPVQNVSLLETMGLKEILDLTK